MGSDRARGTIVTKQHWHQWAVVIVVSVAFATSASAQTTARFNPSRTSGVAPLAVFFDGSLSTASGADSIHDLYYEWDFGDPGSGSWAHSGISKDAGRGPWAAHVFEKTGTYTVRVTVTAPDGSQSSATRTINVSDPDSFYAGAKTVCISASGAFSGCPAGAQHVTSSSFQTGAAHWGTGKRVLFRRGDAFTIGKTLGLNLPGPATIGAYGTGPAPRVTSTKAGPVFKTSGRTPRFDDWRIMDLDFRGPGSQYSSLISGDGTSKRFLALRVSATNFHTAVSFPSSVINYYQQPEMNDQLAFVECSFTDMNGGKGGNGLYLSVNRLIFLGNTVVDSEDAEHILRIQYLGGGVLSHNYLARPAKGKHVVKIHAVTQNVRQSFSERDSHDFLISHNTFQGGMNDWTVALGPQNKITDERVHDVILESNLFLAGPSTRIHMLLWGSRMTVRNNVFQMDGGARHVGVSITRRGIEPPPSDNRAYNNTCYTSDSASSVSCIGASGAAVSTTAINNLVYAPNAGAATAASAGSGTVRDNARLTSNPFVSASPAAALDFRLRAGGAAVDAGGPVTYRGADFEGSPRPTDGDQDGSVQWDLGAFELAGAGGSAPPPPATPPAAPVLLP